MIIRASKRIRNQKYDVDILNSEDTDTHTETDTIHAETCIDTEINTTSNTEANTNNFTNDSNNFQLQTDIWMT